MIKSCFLKEKESSSILAGDINYKVSNDLQKRI
jgi:hypothetical protein